MPGTRPLLSGSRFRCNPSRSMRHTGTPPVVMAELDPAIHAFATYWIRAPEGVDHRVKPGDDDFYRNDQQRHS